MYLSTKLLAYVPLAIIVATAKPTGAEASETVVSSTHSRFRVSPENHRAFVANYRFILRPWLLERDAPAFNSAGIVQHLLLPVSPAHARACPRISSRRLPPSGSPRGYSVYFTRECVSRVQDRYFRGVVLRFQL